MEGGAVALEEDDAVLDVFEVEVGDADVGRGVGDVDEGVAALLGAPVCASIPGVGVAIYDAGTGEAADADAGCVGDGENRAVVLGERKERGGGHDELAFDLKVAVAAVGKVDGGVDAVVLICWKYDCTAVTTLCESIVDGG